MKENTCDRKSDCYFDPLLEFDAPRFYDFNKEDNCNFKEFEEWFKVDHSNQFKHEENSIHNKLTNSYRNRDMIDEKTFIEEESKLEELIRIHNDKIRKRKSCKIENSKYLKLDVIKKKKITELTKDKTVSTNISINSSNNSINNNVNFERIIKYHNKKENLDKKENLSLVNKRTKENISINNNSTLLKVFKNIIPKENNLSTAKTRENKFKKEERNHLISSSLKHSKTNDIGSSKTKLSNLRNGSAKIIKSKSLTYCPRLFDAKTLKKWELYSKKDFYKLSPNSRNEANKEIADMIKTNKL